MCVGGDVARSFQGASVCRLKKQIWSLFFCGQASPPRTAFRLSQIYRPDVWAMPPA